MPEWILVENQNAAEIPPHALMRMVGMTDDGAVLVDQPNADGQTDVLVNGDWPIAPGERGQGHSESPCQVYYDTGNTPAAGETWGATSGSWKLTKGKAGATTLDEGDNERVNVVHGWGRPSTLLAVHAVTLGSTQNDYDWGSYDHLIITTSSAVLLSGLVAASTNGRRLRITNVGPYNVLLYHQSSSSSAANRILTQNAATRVLVPQESVDLFYDTTQARWLLADYWLARERWARATVSIRGG